jgi:hypothetical protein
MHDVIVRFLTLDALNVIPEIYIALVLVWIGIVTVTFLSIGSQRLPLWAKLFWIIVTVMVPIGGVFLYTIFCLLRADYSYLQQMGFFLPTRPKS